jgi:RNA polymerase sigma-70 factor (family 1)
MKDEDVISEQEFETLFHDYYTRLYYFAYDFVSDIEVSKDIVSDVFTLVWENRAGIDKEKLIGYLFISVRNHCLNHLRKQKTSDDYLNFCLQVIQEEGDDSWEDLESRIAEMTKEINKMPARTRYILEECYYHHKKYKEVAEVLEISSDGVKKHISKAFSLLRSHFNVKKSKGEVPDKEK